MSPVRILSSGTTMSRIFAAAAALVFFAVFFAAPLYAAMTICTMPCCQQSAACETACSIGAGNAPEMSAAKANVEAAQLRIVPALTPADPFVSFGGSPAGVMASQSIPWPGKLRLAGDVAASEARELERNALGRTGLTLEARVRNAW